jgi:hypothetical protein
MNIDKKWWADYEERQAEINYLYIYPSLLSAASLVYLLKRRKRGGQKTPELAKI